MRLAIALLLAVLFGCSTQQSMQGQRDMEIVQKYCDKLYGGDSASGSIIGIFKCNGKYRLVFEAPDRPDYYLEENGDFMASCPPRDKNPDCQELLKSCGMMNICRS